ncbi:hypothetical protein HHX47_DHR6000582 [Lentinula edodes]|nr:hypothetical protein HHX47_DHR6000582 [Lentinula edodes]
MSSAGTDSKPIHVPIDPSSRRWSEGYKEKAIRKTKENPWVPLGTLVTTGALTMAAIRLRQGNSRKFQVWLRFRVAFQALTIFAILGGLYKYGQANLEENQRIMEQINQQRGEKHLAMERAELEQRIADATKAHEEQQLLKKEIEQNTKVTPAPGGILSMVSWGKRPAVSEPPEQAETAQLPSLLPPLSPISSGSKSSPSSNAGGSWWNVFGWGSSNTKSDSDSPKKDS